MKSNFLKPLFSGLALINIIICLGQIPEPNFEVEDYPEFLNKKKEILESILYTNESGHYALFANGKFGNGKKSIRKFSLDLQPVNYRLKIKFPKKVIEPKTLEIVHFGNTTFHFWTTRSREGIDYYVQEIDLDQRTIKEKKLIARVDYKKGYSTRAETSIVVKYIEKQLYLSSKIIHGLQQNVAIRIDRFNEKLDRISTNAYNLPYLNENFEIQKVLPYNQESVVLIAKNYFSRNHIKSEKRKEYEYHIYLLANGTSKLLKTISPNNSHLKSLVAKIHNTHLIISGLIDDYNVSHPSGIYFLKYNILNSTTEVEKRERLPESFYNYPEYREEKISTIQLGFPNKKIDADGNYILKELFLTNENEIIITAEQNYDRSSNVPIMAVTNGVIMASINNRTFYSGDIAVIKLNNKGKIMWHSKIIKDQQWGGSQNVLSHFSVYIKNKLFFFYNGNYINLENSFINFLNERDSALMCAVVDENGSLQRKVISYYTEEYPNVVLPILSHNNNTNEIFLFHRAPGNLKRQKFTKVDFR